MRIVERYPLWLRIARGDGAARALLPARFVLSKLYALGLACTGARGREAEASSKSTAAGRRSAAETFRRPIIVSIGNLEAGGGGKTPFAIALAEAIRARGGRAVVVTRGYRGAIEGSGPCVVAAEFKGNVPKGTRLIGTGAVEAHSSELPRAEIAQLAGDEVALYAARRIPVVVDADRVRGARVAAEAFEPTHILLDDAFRHREPAKDLDILLLDAERPFGGGELLPLGTLREPPAAARRAGVVIFTRASEEVIPAAAAPFVEGKPVFFARHEPVALVTGSGDKPMTDIAGREALLFSGIARPASFENLAISLGAKIDRVFRFEDHHRYRRSDVEQILAAGAAGRMYITTEKDYGKTATLFPAEADVRAIRIEMRVSDFERLLELIRA